MNTIFLSIVVVLILLAIFDLVVGVSNDAVNFINSAIGAKAAKFRTIIFVASVGVFMGAATSNGMMDVARHGILSPSYFSFYEVMCIFLAVMVTDVVLIDIFNSLGLPTSTTVAMVFELLGGALAISTVMMFDNSDLAFGQVINTDKAFSVVFALFVSVVIAFLFGTLVQWLSRVLFSFKIQKNGIRVVIFGSIAMTSIIWFLLINGLKGTTFMTPEFASLISHNTFSIILVSFLGSIILMSVLNFFKVNILKVVVLLGTFSLAMAFAGNDLVNFIGVPLAGLSSYQDFITNGASDPEMFMMNSLNEKANTPTIFLLAAGVVMVLSLIFSKKAQNVVRTSVYLSRQEEGDEMFGSSRMSRSIVRTSIQISNAITSWVPPSLGEWVDKRFNTNEAQIEDGAAFDLVRGSVNLMVAGLLVALGTFYKLPLSTTYVTFMVAMGSSLADRAWNRGTAVFRITGVISIIGGWFITAAVAFLFCFLITIIMYFGSYPAMLLIVIATVLILISTNRKFAKKTESDVHDDIFTDLLRSKYSGERLELLWQHMRNSTVKRLAFLKYSYDKSTEAFFHEEYRRLRRIEGEIREERRDMKRLRRKEIIALRMVDPIIAMERNTWFFLANSSLEQMMYCIKRMIEPCREHVGNNFAPVPTKYVTSFGALSNEVDKLLDRTIRMLNDNEMGQAEVIRTDCENMQKNLSEYRKHIIDDIQTSNSNIETMTVFLNIVQETQQLLGSLRHMVRGIDKFQE